MPASRHPLVGLVHKCDVLRGDHADDSGKGIYEASFTTLYAARQCRISILSKDEIELMGWGYASPLNRKVVMVYSPKIIETDFISIPWGVPPNVQPAKGLGDGFANKYTILTPAGSKVLTWDGTKFIDPSGKYTVMWNGTVWVFTDTFAVVNVTHNFTGFRQGQNIFKRPWSTEVGSGYGVVNAMGDPMLYRIAWMLHQIDEVGNFHHTSLIIGREKLDAPTTNY